jgi:hypothetical protein
MGIGMKSPAGAERVPEVVKTWQKNYAPATDPNIASLPSVHNSPGWAGDEAWEGSGFLSGKLLKGDRLKGEFLDGGLRMMPALCITGDAFLLSLDGAQAMLANNGTSRDVYLDTLDGQQRWNAMDAANMTAQNWRGWARLIDNGAPRIDGRYVGGAYVHDDGAFDYVAQGGRNEGKRIGAQPTGMYTYAPDDNGALVIGSGQLGAIADDNPYIDGVPFKLPVKPELAGDFGGWVLCRVNRWTRTACITGLYFGGWGSNQTYHDKLFSFDALLAALAKTIIGLIEVIVGALCIVGTLGGCAPAGVALAITGISTIVAAWYEFAASLDAHKKAVDKAINGGGLSADGRQAALAALNQGAKAGGDTVGVREFFKNHKTGIAIGASAVGALLLG